MPSSKGIRAGRAFVELLAEDGPLRRGLARAQRRIAGFARRVRNIGLTIGAAGAIITAKLAVAFRVFTTLGDELEKMSRRTRLSVESLSLLRFAANQSGTSIEQLGKAVFRMNRRIGNAATGGGPAFRAIDALGLSAEHLLGLSVEERLFAIVDALNAFPDRNIADQFGFELLGDNFRQLAPLLAEGSRGMRELMDEAERRGLRITAEEAALAAAATDAVAAAWFSLKRALFAIGAAVAPLVIEAAEWITRAARRVRLLIDRNKGLVVILAAVGAALIAAGAALLAVSVAGYVAAGAMHALSLAAGVASVAVSILTAALSPLGLSLIGIAAILTVVVAAALYSFGADFRATAATVVSAWGGIVAAVSKGDLALAVRVAWLAIRLEFVRGIGFVKTVYNQFWQGVAVVTVRAGLAVAEAAVSGWAMLRRGMAETAAAMKTIWLELWNTLIESAARAVEFLAKAPGRIAQALGGDSPVIRAQFEAIDRQLAPLRGLKTDTSGGRAAIDADRRAELDAIDESERRRLAKLGDIQRDLLDHIGRRTTGDMAELEKELADARAELRAALKEAGAPAGALAGEGGAGGAGAADVADLAAAQQAIQGFATFSGAAAQRLAAGSQTTLGERLAQLTLDEQRQVRRLMQEQNELIRGGGVVFAR